MRAIFVFIVSRLKQMPFGIRLLSGLCVFTPILVFSFYIRGDSQVPVGLPKVLLIAIGSAVFAYGFLLATRWSRPLMMLYQAGALIWAVIQNHATYSLSDYLGWLVTIGFIVWILYFRRDVRDYYARAHETVA
jgi:hypothetical protein